MATKRAKKTDVVSPSSAELRKAVEAIAIQPKSGKITLLTRKLFNVLLAVAQQADESGDTYRALLSDIVANSAFDSNDTALVKEHLRRMRGDPQQADLFAIVPAPAAGRQMQADREPFASRQGAVERIG